MITRNDPAYQDALSFLYGRLNYERTDSIAYDKADFRLDRMRRLLNELGNPHKSVPTIHVAGTKGKGSTSHFLSSILTAAGYRTGCYTSPHLIHIEERFAINGEPCPPDQLVELVAQMRPLVQHLDRQEGPGAGPTFFEITTAMAMLHFHTKQCDLMVLEVGLGGRLDSTNVCQPILCLITSISFDHMRQLGNTLAAIAGEKAGIIKPGVPVITGVREAEPLAVIQRVAAEHKSRLQQLGRDFDFHYEPPRFDRADTRPTMDYWRTGTGLEGPDELATNVALGALGQHQAANASLAWAAAETLRELGFAVDDDAIREGVATSRCPGRIEIVSREPTILIDTAHNEASIRALVRVLRESFPGRPRTLVLAVTQGKAITEMLRLLVPEFDVIYCTQYTQNPRALSAAELLRLTEQATAELDPAPRLVSTATPTEAWNDIKRRGNRELVCVTGSFFLAAEMKQFLQAGNL